MKAASHHRRLSGSRTHDPISPRSQRSHGMSKHMEADDVKVFEYEFCSCNKEKDRHVVCHT